MNREPGYAETSGAKESPNFRKSRPFAGASTRICNTRRLQPGRLLTERLQRSTQSSPRPKKFRRLQPQLFEQLRGVVDLDVAIVRVRHRLCQAPEATEAPTNCGSGPPGPKWDADSGGPARHIPRPLAGWSQRVAPWPIERTVPRADCRGDQEAVGGVQGEEGEEGRQAIGSKGGGYQAG